MLRLGKDTMMRKGKLSDLSLHRYALHRLVRSIDDPKDACGLMLDELAIRKKSLHDETLTLA